MTTWFGRSQILLPADWREWSDDRLQSVLLHEKAHINRRDWWWNLAGQATCTLYWINPLVWALQKQARARAEEAADDIVLRAGVEASRYAGDLLQIAKQMRSHNPRLALPIATDRHEVSRRVELILKKDKQRGGVGLTTLALCGAIAAALIVPIATYVFGYQNPTSWLKDVREGKTQPGTSGNDYIGTLADGRKVRLIQVTRWTPSGVIGWKPDGTPLASSELVKAPVIDDKRDGDHLRTILFQFVPLDQEAQAGLGSGSPVAGEPQILVFAGGGSKVQPDLSRCDAYSFIGVPKEDGEYANFTLTVEDKPWHTDIEFSLNDTVVSPKLGDVQTSYPAKAHPWLRDAKDRMVYKDGKPMQREVVATAISLPEHPLQNCSVRLFAILKDGRKVGSIWNEQSPGSTSPEPTVLAPGQAAPEQREVYYFAQKPSEIARIKIEARELSGCEFLKVHLKPKAGG